MHLADRLHNLEQDLNQLKERVDRKSEEFAGLLEQALEGENDAQRAAARLALVMLAAMLWAAPDAYRRAD